jgi:hypothetical protein
MEYDKNAGLESRVAVRHSADVSFQLGIKNNRDLKHLQNHHVL